MKVRGYSGGAHGRALLHAQSIPSLSRIGITPRRHNEHRETKDIQTESNDKDAAERLAVSLSSRDYPCYLDTFDPNVDGDSPELESYLRRVIDLCNNLMAMVSRTTRMSWWVPLEIGVALEKEKHIATYLLTAEDLPIYLWQWPMLRSDRDALQWAQDTQGETVSGMNRRWRMRDRSEKLSYAR